MKGKEVNISQLATSLLWWLSYTSAIGRNYILNEGSIKIPVAEYFERSRINNIVLEHSHPKFSKKRLDLYVEQNSTKSIAFEFKYIKNGSTRTSTEKKRILEDLMRLYFLLGKHRKGLFLICGNQSDFIKDFQKIKPDSKTFITPQTAGNNTNILTSQGFYTEWFSFDHQSPERNIDLQTTNSTYKNIYDNFFSEYQKPHKDKTNKQLKMPSKIKTKLLFLSGEINKPSEDFKPAKVGIWEIIKK